MKKRYVSPFIRVARISHPHILADSWLGNETGDKNDGGGAAKVNIDFDTDFENIKNEESEYLQTSY